MVQNYVMCIFILFSKTYINIDVKYFSATKEDVVAKQSKEFVTELCSLPDKDKPSFIIIPSSYNVLKEVGNYINTNNCNIGIITSLSSSIGVYNKPIISIDQYPEKIIDNVLNYITNALKIKRINVIGSSNDLLSLYYNKRIIELSEKYSYTIINKRCSKEGVLIKLLLGD